MNMNEMRSHNHQFHFDEVMTCRECNANYKTFSGLTQHVQKKHNMKARIPLANYTDNREINFQTFRMYLNTHLEKEKSMKIELEQAKKRIRDLEQQNVALNVKNWQLEDQVEAGKARERRLEAEIKNLNDNEAHERTVSSLLRAKEFELASFRELKVMCRFDDEQWNQILNAAKQGLIQYSMKIVDVIQDKDSFYRSAADLILG